MRIVALVGTVKGAFVVRSDEPRDHYAVEGPLFKGWEATAALRSSSGAWYLGLSSRIYGPSVHRSEDLAEWRAVDLPPAYPEGGKRRLQRIWALAEGHGRMWAGVDDAGLFVSDDGERWEPVAGINEHPTRDAWQPANGGLALHSILVDPQDARRLWCGISPVGVFRSDDGGATFAAKNDGVRVIVEDRDHPEIGFCVHALVQEPGATGRLWRQDHVGMYRSDDAGESWQRDEQGLPSSFGFPLALDPSTRSVFAVPLESEEYRMPPEGRLRVYRRRPETRAWEALAKGLPQTHTYTSVLRGALAVDGLQPCGIYMGTTAGMLHVSKDGGESWRTLPVVLPRILSVTVATEPGHA